MKISFCSIAFRKTKEPLTSIIPILAELGYEGVEIWANHLSGDGSDVHEIDECLRENRLSVPMISPYFNVTGSVSDWHASLKSAETCFGYASTLGVPLIRTFTGFLGGDEADDETWTRAVARLRDLCDLANEQNIGLALETHPKTLVDTVPSIHRLIKDVERPNLVLNLDIYHLWEQHLDPAWIWAQTKSYVRHAHAKNALIPPKKDDEYPLFHDKQGQQDINGVTYLNEGNMDYAPFLKCLAEDKFSGWFSVEWFGENPITAAAHELSWIKNSIEGAENEMAVT